MPLNEPRLHLALVHYPVLDKNGATIAAAVTNLDLHDIARAARTYGVRGYHIVTPVADQHELVNELRAHWVAGHGARYNPKRRQALELVQLHHKLADAIASIEDEEGARPRVVATSARFGEGCLRFGQLRGQLEQGRVTLLVLGTGWGLAPECVTAADDRLEPIDGPTDYNHLSVRSAAAIMLDRLLAPERG
jgi:hypothetical protein